MKQGTEAREGCSGPAGPLLVATYGRPKDVDTAYRVLGPALWTFSDISHG